MTISAAMKTDASRAHLLLLRDLQRHPRNIIAYTDGSQLATATGAGFTIPTGLPTVVNAVVPMGTTAEVFDAEVRAIYECLLTCLKYVRRHRLHRRNIHMFADNQAAISRAASLHRGPGQEVAHHIHETAHDLHAYAVTITVHWVPGHTDIPGNEAADRLAKQATAMPPTRQQPISLTLLRRRVRERHTADWEEWYDTSPQPKSYSAPHRKRMDST
jgi:ribonuclease HI